MQTLDINNDNTLKIRVVVNPEYPPEYKQHQYQLAKREFAIELYKSLEQLTTPVVVELYERPLREVYSQSNSWYQFTDGWEFGALLYKTHHRHITIDHPDYLYSLSVVVGPKKFYGSVVKFFKNMIKSMQ